MSKNTEISFFESDLTSSVLKGMFATLLGYIIFASIIFYLQGYLKNNFQIEPLYLHLWAIGFALIYVIIREASTIQRTIGVHSILQRQTQQE